MVSFIISSSVFILIVILLRCLCHKHISMRLQYMLWLLVAMKLLIFPVPWIESNFSIFNIPDKLESMTDRRTNDFSTEKTTIAPENIIQQEYYNQAVQNNNIQNNKATFLGHMSLQAVLSTLAVTGTCIFFIFWLITNLKFWRYLRKHRINVTPYKIDLPFEMNLKIYAVPQLPTPCLYGKAIYMTQDSMMDETELRHILAHEYSHYRQGDLLWSVIRGICLSIYWWNPLVWIAAYLSKQDCELSCDEAALKLLGENERLDYGKTLLNLITANSNPKDYFSVATTMTKGTKSLKRRISIIAHKPRIMISVSIVVIFAAVLGFLSTSTAKSNEENDISITSGTYIMEETENELVTTALTIDTDNQTLSFPTDPLSSYLPFCNYEIEKNYIKAKTEDGLYHYTLEILDEETLMFVGNESSEPIVIDDRIFTAPYDGAIFKLSTESFLENTSESLSEPESYTKEKILSWFNGTGEPEADHNAEPIWTEDGVLYRGMGLVGNDNLIY